MQMSKAARWLKDRLRTNSTAMAGAIAALALCSATPAVSGVNRVTGSFPGSIDIRPEVMTELMTDVFRSLAKAGFAQVFCITGPTPSWKR